MDAEEYDWAITKKGSRTWHQVLMDGLEFKSYSPMSHKAKKSKKTK